MLSHSKNLVLCIAFLLFTSCVNNEAYKDIEITYSFNEACQILGQPILAREMTEVRALLELREKVHNLGGDTLLFDKNGLQELDDYNVRVTQENDQIVTSIPMEQLLSAGVSEFRGAALRCK